MILLTTLIVILGTLSSAIGEDLPRFSTGPFHSGSLEFEVDLTGAEHLSISSSGAAAMAEWLEAELTDEDGKVTRLEQLRKAVPVGGAARADYDIAGKGVVRLSASVRLSNEDGESGRILVFHDAPRPESSDKILQLKGDPRQGRSVFGRGTCSSCHVLDGRGGRVGPDLSDLGSRSTLEEIIESIITPDAMLAEGFETTILTAKDGTPHLGYVVADSPDSITIKDSAGQSHEIAKEELVSRQTQTFSMMPPFGDLLSSQQIADLAAFLISQKQGG